MALPPRPSSVQPQLGDVSRVGLRVATLDAPDELGEGRVGAAGQSDLLALANDEPVEEFDLRAPALEHVLAHRGALLGRGSSSVLEPLLVVSAHCRVVALARPRN